MTKVWQVHTHARTHIHTAITITTTTTTTTNNDNRTKTKEQQTHASDLMCDCDVFYHKHLTNVAALAIVSAVRPLEGEIVHLMLL